MASHMTTPPFHVLCSGVEAITQGTNWNATILPPLRITRGTRVFDFCVILFLYTCDAILAGGYSGISAMKLKTLY